VIGDWFNRWLPTAASSHAARFDGVLAAAHTEGAVIFLGWLAVFAIILVRFRARPGVRPGRPAGRHWPLVAVAAIVAGEVWLLAGSALPAWFERAVPAPAGAAEVRVIGEQFAWNVHYPGPDLRFGRTLPSLITAADPIGIDRSDPPGADDFVLIGVLVVPVDRPTVVHLSSKDVIHSFTLATMRVKQDVTPGLPVSTWFTPITTGSWEVGCSQLCGLGHYRMRALFEVRTEDAWRAFVAEEVALATAP
jgi:cytochrome c oxidase subunit II